MIFNEAFRSIVLSLGLLSGDVEEYREVRCLSEAVYFESRGENKLGKKAVASVILNRSNHNAYPDTVCDVVKQRRQFSYRNDGIQKTHKINMLDKKQVENLRNIIVLSFLAYEYGLKDNTGGATHFAKRNISNSWTKKLERTTRIGNHVFYRFS